MVMINLVHTIKCVRLPEDWDVSDVYGLYWGRGEPSKDIPLKWYAYPNEPCNIQVVIPDDTYFPETPSVAAMNNIRRCFFRFHNSYYKASMDIMPLDIQYRRHSNISIYNFRFHNRTDIVWDSMEYMCVQYQFTT